MNESVLWLLYVLSGLVAFGAVFRFGWRIVPAMLGGAAITMAGWLILYLLTEEKNRPDWITVDLSLNACFGLIFAGLGAAVAYFVQWQRQER